MGNRRILLLSDGSEIFPVLNRVFTAEGYQVITTSSSQGAVEAIRTGDFHLLITRITKTRRKVFPVLRSIRKQNPKPITIFLRGDHEVNSPLEAYQLSGNEEIFIPCGWAGLRRLVASCLSG